MQLEKAKPFIRWLAGLTVAGLSIWLLIKDLDWFSVFKALAEADYRWVVVGVAAIVATFFTRAFRWKALLWNSHLPLRSAITAILVGQVVNLALPMRSGDVLRALWISPEGELSAAEALGSIAIEKIWDLLALLVCGLAILILMPIPDWFARSTWTTALIFPVLIAVIWCALRWQNVLFRWISRILALAPLGWDKALLSFLSRLTNGLEAIRRPETYLKVLLWTGFTWLSGGVANWAVLEAFGIPSLKAALFLLATLMAGGTVPVPGRLGIFEGICVISLALFGVPRDLALAVGLVLHLVVMAPPLVAAGILGFWPQWRKSNVRT